MRKPRVLFALLLSALFTSPAFAAEIWQDLDEGDTVILNQTVTFHEESQNSLELKKGKTFQIQSVAGLPGLSVVLFTLTPETCEDANFKSEMELIQPVADPEANSEVGVTFGEACQFEVFVAAKDLARPGLFNR